MNRLVKKCTRAIWQGGVAGANVFNRGLAFHHGLMRVAEALGRRASFFRQAQAKSVRQLARLGGRNDPQVRSIVSASLAGHLVALLTIRGRCLPLRSSDWRQLVEVEGEEHILTTLNRGKKLIIVVTRSLADGGLGRYLKEKKLLGRILDAGLLDRKHAKEAAPQGLDRVMAGARDLYLAQKSLVSGSVVVAIGNGLGATTEEKLVVTILNRRIHLARGYADLAVRCDAVVIPATAILLPRGRFGFRFHPPLNPGPETMPKEDRVRSLVNGYARVWSDMILERPESVPLPWIRYLLQAPAATTDQANEPTGNRDANSLLRSSE